MLRYFYIPYEISRVIGHNGRVPKISVPPPADEQQCPLFPNSQQSQQQQFESTASDFFCRCCRTIIFLIYLNYFLFFSSFENKYP